MGGNRAAGAAHLLNRAGERVTLAPRMKAAGDLTPCLARPEVCRSASLCPRPSEHPVAPFAPKWRALYPSAILNGDRPSTAEDIALLCRSVMHVAGTSWVNRSGSLPGALGRLLRDAADGEYADAWELRELVTAAAAKEYGAPKYSPLQSDEPNKKNE